jgi:hypothetical protein
MPGSWCLLKIAPKSTAKISSRTDSSTSIRSSIPTATRSSCRRERTGKIVRIELLGDLLAAGFYLSMAEVEVYSLPSGSEICTNGTDDDGDTKIDCADEDCAGRPACAGGTFHRGDADDNGQLQLTDAIRILGVLFLGQGVITCTDAADADDNGSLQLTDAIRVLGVLFLGQGTIPAPGRPRSRAAPIRPLTPAARTSAACPTLTAAPEAVRRAPAAARSSYDGSQYSR